MTTNLTGVSIASTYDQLLHVDDGPAATEKTVYSGTGVATAMKVGTISASVGNVQLAGNTVQATTGDLILGSAIAFGSANNARTALGLGTMATQNSGAVDINSGAIDGTTVGATTAASVKGTTVEATTSIGYPTGTGGTVTQGTSRTTGVTLNKITGEIVLFAGSLGGHDAEEFTLTNSLITGNDVIMLCIKNGADAATRKYYQVHAVAVAAGSCVISVGNIDNTRIPSAGTESPVIQFLVLKGAIA